MRIRNAGRSYGTGTAGQHRCDRRPHGPGRRSAAGHGPDPSPPHSPAPARPSRSSPDGLQRKGPGGSGVPGPASSTGSRDTARAPKGPGHPPHPPLLNFNRRAADSPLRPQRPIRAGDAAASQSQRPPPSGPRPPGGNCSRHLGARDRPDTWNPLPDPLFPPFPSPPLSPPPLLYAGRAALPLGFPRPRATSEVRVCGGVGRGGPTSAGAPGGAGAT